MYVSLCVCTTERETPAPNPSRSFNYLDVLSLMNSCTSWYLRRRDKRRNVGARDGIWRLSRRFAELNLSCDSHHQEQHEQARGHHTTKHDRKSLLSGLLKFYGMF